MNNNNIIQENTNYSLKVTKEHAGLRIDVFLAMILPMFSRSLLKKLLTNKQVIINQVNPAKPSYVIKDNDTITLLSIPTPTERIVKQVVYNLGIKIIARHDDFLIINKPAGLVVHPPQQTFTDTALTDWIVQEFPQAATVGEATRPGIVHRLDRNTSGIMIIALTQQAHATFTAMFKNRSIQKTYIALVVGHPKETGTIDYPIGRHPVQKNIMHCFTTTPENTTARDAQTDYKVLQYFDTYSLVELKPKTGRTHQIRVHFKAIGHPLLGDTTYGTASKKFGYHALHAQNLEFNYNGIAYQFSCPVDQKLQKLIDTSKPVKK
ncbi:RluA family pseudouridine synthase [Candidatus Babeliales bacterium]|nr:RluA family pseudouridine synthase [Candidatus Babeliales bacterium]MBP9844110.1 RluA family pseudouridine synthase [Candidatus Babeliales bacterium]